MSGKEQTFIVDNLDFHTFLENTSVMWEYWSKFFSFMIQVESDKNTEPAEGELYHT